MGDSKQNEAGDRFDLASLYLRARAVADGFHHGGHQSRQRGAGLEFAGHRAYCPGDDLRWLDQRAVLRQDRLVIKQFEMETDRHVQLLVDATASMNYQSAAQHPPKYEFAATLATALAMVALRGGDRAGLSLLGSEQPAGMGVAASSLPETARRIAQALESRQPAGHLGETAAQFDKLLLSAAHRTRRGSLLVLFSDLLDLPAGAEQSIAALSSGGRQLLVVQILDPQEASFQWEGPVRFRSPETGVEVETNATTARAPYLRALQALQSRINHCVRNQGGDSIQCVTSDLPLSVLREIVRTSAARTSR